MPNCQPHPLLHGSSYSGPTQHPNSTLGLVEVGYPLNSQIKLVEGLERSPKLHSKISWDFGQQNRAKNRVYSYPYVISHYSMESFFSSDTSDAVKGVEDSTQGICLIKNTPHFNFFLRAEKRLWSN